MHTKLKSLRFDEDRGSLKIAGANGFGKDKTVYIDIENAELFLNAIKIGIPAKWQEYRSDARLMCAGPATKRKRVTPDALNGLALHRASVGDRHLQSANKLAITKNVPSLPPYLTGTTVASEKDAIATTRP